MGVKLGLCACSGISLSPCLCHERSNYALHSFWGVRSRPCTCFWGSTYALLLLGGGQIRTLRTCFGVEVVLRPGEAVQAPEVSLQGQPRRAGTGLECAHPVYIENTTSIATDDRGGGLLFSSLLPHVRRAQYLTPTRDFEERRSCSPSHIFMSGKTVANTQPVVRSP